MNTAVYILNRTPSTQTPDTTPFEIWNGRRPTLGHIRLFGSEAFTLTPKEKRTKLEAKGKRLILVGYENNSTNYRLLDPETKKITVSRHVIFNETTEVNSKVQTTTIHNPSQHEEDVLLEEDGQQSEEESADTGNPNQSNGPVLRPREPLRPPDRYEAILVETDIQQSYDEAMSNPDSKEWAAAIKEEIDGLDKNETWEMTTLPPDKRCFDSKWIFKIKRYPDGNIQRYKARVVARGFSQVEGVDYTQTFAPTARYDTIRVLLALSVKKDLKISQFDIKTAFLHGLLKEEVYMNVPDGVKKSTNMVRKLKRALYGLKQAPRCWYRRFDDFLRNLGFRQCQADKCVYFAKL